MKKAGWINIVLSGQWRRWKPVQQTFLREQSLIDTETSKAVIYQMPVAPSRAALSPIPLLNSLAITLFKMILPQNHLRLRHGSGSLAVERIIV